MPLCLYCRLLWAGHTAHGSKSSAAPSFLGRRHCIRQHAAHPPPIPACPARHTRCGPARHSILLAKQVAKQGCRVTCLDLHAGMLEYAGQRAKEAGVELELVQGDMAAFDLPGRENQLDLVLCVIGTFSHLQDNASAAAAMRCIARHLRPGGLFILELGHPGEREWVGREWVSFAGVKQGHACMHEMGWR